jgi:hypothetical protein
VKPNELTGEEFTAVRALILEGTEVDGTRLSDHLKSSHRIALIVREGQLACVGAIKAARPHYVQSIARKSGFALDAENCGGEFGYVVTKAAFRRQGLANDLSVALLKSFAGKLYATTRHDNPGIHRIVLENGFQHVGENWRSTEHPDSFLMLWLKGSHGVQGGKGIHFRHLFHGTSSRYKAEIQEHGLLATTGRLHLTTHPYVALLEAQRTVCGEEGFPNAYKPGVGGFPLIVQVERSAVLHRLKLDAEYYDKTKAAGRRLVQIRAAFVTDAQIGTEHLSFPVDLETTCDRLVEEINWMTRLPSLAPCKSV